MSGHAYLSLGVDNAQLRISCAAHKFLHCRTCPTLFESDKNTSGLECKRWKAIVFYEVEEQGDGGEVFKGRNTVYKEPYLR